MRITVHVSASRPGCFGRLVQDLAFLAMAGGISYMLVTWGDRQAEVAGASMSIVAAIAYFTTRGARWLLHGYD